MGRSLWRWSAVKVCHVGTLQHASHAELARPVWNKNMSTDRTAESLGTLVLRSARETFASQKHLAERAMTQLTEEQLRRPLDENTNSIAVIAKNIAGNMLSRWTELLTSDGEKPWRRRDDEFIDDFASREAMFARWEEGWQCLFDTIDGLTEADLTRVVPIRGEPHTVVEAIDRQLSHYGYHVGQIVQVARVLAQDRWQVLTVPRGQSEEFNRRHWQS